jgi:hypothetical protein
MTMTTPSKPPPKPKLNLTPIGRFFSMEKGRVGQFLSPRVLLVRKPFQNQVVERCYFGFDSLHQARKFTEYLAHTGRYFRLDKSEYMPQRYEIEIFNPGDVAKTLAYWDRQYPSVEPTELAAA